MTGTHDEARDRRFEGTEHDAEEMPRRVKDRADTVKMPATMRELARAMVEYVEGEDEPPLVRRRLASQTEYAFSGDALIDATEAT